MKRLWFMAAAMMLAAPVHAQSLMGEYYTTISARDMVNSSGARLGNACAIIQQDRANYHRFGKRDDGDQGDPVFADGTMRARIVNTCEFVRGSEYVRDRILAGRPKYIWVRILNDQGQLRVLVSEGAG